MTTNYFLIAGYFNYMSAIN